MTLIFRLIIRRDIWIFHSKVFSSELLNLHRVRIHKSLNCKTGWTSFPYRGASKQFPAKTRNELKSDNCFKTRICSENARYGRKWSQESSKTNSHTLFLVKNWHLQFQYIVLAIFFINIWCNFVLLNLDLMIYTLEKDNFADLAHI